MSLPVTGMDLAAAVIDARARTLSLVADLDDAQLLGPRLAIVNPLRWEIGHVAWFMEKWILRDCAGRAPMIASADALYDSSAVPHDTRWDLPLPTRAQTLAYLADTRDAVLERLARGIDERERYFVTLSVFHEDMHDEAFTYTRQTHGWPAPPEVAAAAATPTPAAEPLPAGDAELPGGAFRLGAEPGTDDFVFDNEKWAYAAPVRAFRMSRTAVTQGEFAAFVDDGGYRRRDLWSEAGWAWRTAAAAEQPLWWRAAGAARWQRRLWDRWVDLEPNVAMIHVGWYEAEAYCTWAGRRLPSELEWEYAAAGAARRGFPWGDAAPGAAHANLDRRAAGCVDVRAHAAGDSPEGIRQLWGNAWEWTSSWFNPYPGFVADPYRDYSQPWMATHKVLRGGAWCTSSRLLRNTWRNFYMPDRRDVWAGFRTCAR